MNRNTGRVLEEGDILIRSRFAETLQLIATYGADILYNGTLGDELVSDIQQLGGIITKMDLQQYRLLSSSHSVHSWDCCQSHIMFNNYAH